MAEIYKAYGKMPPKPTTPSGSRWEPHFVEMYDEYGQPYLVRDGETDTYAEIQSYKDSCDIHVLLERYANGDMSVMARQGQYIDISGLPQTWHEVFNTLQSQRDQFDRLPIAVKEKFGHSFEQWAAQAGTEKWLDNMGYTKRTKNDSAATEAGQDPNGSTPKN